MLILKPNEIGGKVLETNADAIQLLNGGVLLDDGNTLLTNQIAQFGTMTVVNTASGESAIIRLKGSPTPVIVDGDASIVIGLATATKIGVDFDTDQYKIDNLTGGPVFIDFSFVV